MKMFALYSVTALAEILGVLPWIRLVSECRLTLDFRRGGLEDEFPVEASHKVPGETPGNAQISQLARVC